MMRTIIIVLLIALAPAGMQGQRIKEDKIEATGQVPYPDDKSEREVKREAETEAIFNGLVETYGRVVMKGSQLVVVNRDGKETESKEQFTMFGGDYVLGEYLKTLDTNCEPVFVPTTTDGRNFTTREYRCTLKFLARKVSEAKPEFDAFPMWALDKKSQTTQFDDGDNLYLYFKSPSTGFLSVFLNMGTTTQCLLPYKEMGPEYEDGVPIDRDKEYFLFSLKDGYNYWDSRVDNYILEADKEMEPGRLVIIFSKERITKPGLEDGSKLQQATKDERAGYDYPRALPTAKFEEWKKKKQSQSKTMAISEIEITISKTGKKPK